MVNTTQAQAQMDEVRVKGHEIIQPEAPTFNGIIPLTECDQVMSRTYIPSVYFYNGTNSKCDQVSISSILRDSLARILVHFYPLAGRMIYHIDPNNCLDLGTVELRCGGGAMLIEAESNKELAEYGDFSDLHRVQNFIPSLNQYDRNPKEMHKIPLLLVQITHFRCGGFSLGLLMSHGVLDGISASHFLREWSRIARGEPLESPPFFDRTLLGAREPSKEESSNPEQAAEEVAPLPYKAMKLSPRAMLPLSKSQVNKLKNMTVAPANDSSEDATNKVGRPYSRYEVITAHIWRSFCKTMGYDHKSEVQMALGVHADVRSRIQPPLPSNYFGNGMVVVPATSSAGNIIADQQLTLTCERLRNVISQVNNDYILSEIEDMGRLKAPGKVFLRTVDGNKVPMDLSAVSWLALPLYALDFGWGEEICMRPGLKHLDGAFVIMPGQRNDEPGRVDVLVSLQQHEIDCFKKHFYQDIPH